MLRIYINIMAANWLVWTSYNQILRSFGGKKKIAKKIHMSGLFKICFTIYSFVLFIKCCNFMIIKRNLRVLLKDNLYARHLLLIWFQSILESWLQSTNSVWLSHFASEYLWLQLNLVKYSLANYSDDIGILLLFNVQVWFIRKILMRYTKSK